jgi:hypothetical protein
LVVFSLAVIKLLLVKEKEKEKERPQSMSAIRCLLYSFFSKSKAPKILPLPCVMPVVNSNNH